MTPMDRTARALLALALVAGLGALSGCSSCEPRGILKVVSDDADAYSIDCLEGCGEDAVITRLGNEADRTWRLELSSLDTPITVAVLDSDGDELSRGSVDPEWGESSDCSEPVFAPDIHIG